MATKTTRGRTTLTELKHTTVAERGAEHIAPGVRATTTTTRHIAFMSDGSVIQRDAYKVVYANMPPHHFNYDTADSGTWYTVIKPTDTRRDLNRKKTSADASKLAAIIEGHAPRIALYLERGYTEVKGAR